MMQETQVDYPLIFEISHPGRQAFSLPDLDVPRLRPQDVLPASYLRVQTAALPELSEVDVIRHFTGLSKRNHGVDSGFYPLGSCTMKYNPKRNEVLARLSGFTQLHPLQPEDTVQGALEMMFRLQGYLAEITGMDAVSLQPSAGAAGEWTALLMIRAYHESRGDHRRKVLIPDSAHGTNPASASFAGLETVTIASNAQGGVDLAALRAAVDANTAALMLTNPSTLGLFEENIEEIAAIVHDAGGLLYYDGANANAILGYTRPGDMGFDAVHLNLHKTFATPHGGGGPGAGPVGVKSFLVPFLPAPTVGQNVNGTFYLDRGGEQSIGSVKGFYGNFGVLVRAYAYIRTMGADGLKRVAEDAVLHANYLKHRLSDGYDVAFDRLCKHEFVLSAKRYKANGVRTLDIAKRLLDFGYHPPTIYFPLNVEEAMMIEPTETESLATLDAFADVLLQIAKEAQFTPEVVLHAPHQTVVNRLDEALAARNPVLVHPLS